MAQFNLAYTVRSSSTPNAQTVRKLDAFHRWCITGTPLQNRISDISSLLRFLKVHPYDNPKTFDIDIIQPWKKATDEKPLQRLHVLMKMMIIHRGKKTIPLPAREELINAVGSNAKKQNVCDAAREGTIQLLDQTLNSGSASAFTYLNAFQRMNELRYIRNLGSANWREEAKSKDIAQVAGEGLTNEHELDHLLENSDTACLNCGTDISVEQEACDEPSSPIATQADQLRLCMGCVQSKWRNTPQLPAPPGSFSENMPLGNADEALPSKLSAVMAHVLKFPCKDKCVIFSVWTSMLDVMHEGLQRAGISCCRFQGSMRYAKRTESLRQFEEDPTIKVILISITCGGQGLNLTTANHCILIEPHWNPMVEEQAISRIYRLDQEKPVFITRFVINNTFEQKVLERQTRKNLLTDLVLGRQKLKEGDDGKKQLAHLRQLIC